MTDSPPLLSLGEAATLTGLPRRALRARVQRGQIPVRLIGKGRSAKLRFTAKGLVEAGLLGDEIAVAGATAPSSSDAIAPLLDLLREQAARIASLEDQRFQLAGQLGAAVERTRSLEEQLPSLAAPGPPRDATVRTAARSSDSDRAGARTPDDVPEAERSVGIGGFTVRQAPDSPDATQPAISSSPRPSRAWRVGALVRRGTLRMLTGS